jgi:hypothetical protein
MKPSLCGHLIIGATVGLLGSASGAGFLDFLKPKPATATNSLAGLSQEQLSGGLREALGKGVEKAIATLGKPDGFLKDLDVRIPMPASLQKVEQTLRSLGQARLTDEFVTTMNRAAEQAVPEAAGVLADSVKQMSIANAKSILTGTNDAATQYFRRTSETNLQARFLPIVKTATAKAGMTSAYKRMTGQAAGGLGGLGTGLLGKEMPDLDDYITRKSLDGLFLKIAEQEKQIRENAVARTSELMQKVFGAVHKQE